MMKLSLLASLALLACGSKPPTTTGSTAASGARCASTADALAKLPAPAIVTTDKLPWPPASDGKCQVSTAADLDGDKRPEVQVACTAGMGEHAFLLYHQLADGCLAPLGEIVGVEWSVGEGARTAGFAPLRSHSRPSSGNVDEVTYTFDAATKQYAAGKSETNPVP